MSRLGGAAARMLTRAVRRYLVGPQQRWVFQAPPADWAPPPVERTSLYLHVPFCRNLCPYCPYTKVPYDPDLLAPYTRAALAEVDGWAERIGPAEITSIYIGGGTPTLALGSIAAILARVRQRFRLAGDICIETNPADVDEATVRGLRDAGVSLVSLGVQSFRPANLALIGRRYTPAVAERALDLLAQGGLASLNVDLMFALPGQLASEVTADLARAAQLGATQLTTYPLFTFPYTSVGQYLRLAEVRMPGLRARRTHYRAINAWCAENGYERVSVWGFRRGSAPRYSSVTRDGYIGIGPGAGSHLPDGFALNTFDLASWMSACEEGRMAVALRMPFTPEMAAWWWLYWRLYDTRIPLAHLDAVMGSQAPKARRLLAIAQRAGLAVAQDHTAAPGQTVGPGQAAGPGAALTLTEPGAFWLHLAQNYFALRYVNTLWTQARREPWPRAVAL